MPICGDLLSYADHQAEHIIWNDSLWQKTLTCGMVYFQAAEVYKQRQLSAFGESGVCSTDHKQSISIPPYILGDAFVLPALHRPCPPNSEKIQLPEYGQRRMPKSMEEFHTKNNLCRLDLSSCEGDD